MIKIKGKEISEAQMIAVCEGHKAFKILMEERDNIRERLKAAEALYDFCSPFWREEEEDWNIGLEDAAHEFYELLCETRSSDGKILDVSDGDRLQIFNFAKERYELVREYEKENFLN